RYGPQRFPCFARRRDSSRRRPSAVALASSGRASCGTLSSLQLSALSYQLEWHAVHFFGAHWRSKFHGRRRSIARTDRERALGAFVGVLDGDGHRAAHFVRHVIGAAADDDRDGVVSRRVGADALE